MSELAQVFTGTKLVEGRTLNVAGAQPARAAIARLLYRLRAGSRDALASELARTGFVACRDFLPRTTLAAAVREAEDCATQELPNWIHQNGTTIVRNYALDRLDPERFPNLWSWPHDERALSLVAAGERRPVRPSVGSPFLEHITFGDDSDPDPQTVLHLDVFFNTHKVWLYLDDVTEENGALVYVPGSHRLDGVRLREEYRDSTNQTRCPEPSRRVHQSEVERRDLARRVMAYPSNTLVVVNTCGYHCRSVGRAGASRRALHMSFRFNPFHYPMPRVSRILRSTQRGVRRLTSGGSDAT